jgi:transaldolase/glucose-6-phosphate isomerase
MNPVKALQDHGQSVWLDFLARGFIAKGYLQKLVDEDGLGGVTSNPSIFEKAIVQSDEYDQAIGRMLERKDRSVGDLYEQLAVSDIRHACDVLRPVFDAQSGADGFVSIEVSPYLAMDTRATIAEAHRLWNAVDRKNLMIKVPATPPGLPAVEALIAEGMNINITLLFSQKTYEQVADAYLRGLEALAARGGDVSQVASVASFFVSRIDTAVDKLLDAKIAQANDPDEQSRLSKLKGKVAIANAKLAYQRYKRLFAGKRWEALQAKGAKPQRLLWASTGTKNKAYRDVLYVEELIGPSTVNTMPLATLEAFRDHGMPRDSLQEDVGGASAVLEDLSRSGISLDTVTSKLVTEGVQLFADAADELLAAVANKRSVLVGAGLNTQRLALGGPLERAADATAQEWRASGKIRRLFRRDKSLWTNSDEDKWLGWLDSVDKSLVQIALYQELAQEVKRRGFRDAVLLGMGGSSLGPEVLAQTLGNQPGWPRLRVLDTTVPAQIEALEAEIDVSKTLFIVSSKSGSTTEPNILKAYFFARVADAIGREQAGKRFVAVTDPGSSLERTAAEDGFWRVFHGVPSIGGRYSVLSPFGLVPAAAIGIDVARLLQSAQIMVRSCGEDVPPSQNPGVQLGVAFADAAVAGRDKLTLLASPRLADFGAWAEQLIAESTGKNGRGLIPVDAEPLGDPQVYGTDRFFVDIRTAQEQDAAHEQAIKKLEQAGHPIARIVVNSVEQIGQEFFRFELAIAVAGAILEINPFDQPDVEASKTRTRELISAYERTGALPPETPVCSGEHIDIYADAQTAETLRKAGADGSVEQWLKAHFARVGEGDYSALLAYIARNKRHIEVLQELRLMLCDRRHVATCVGFGPRFLHSTGQAYKGGPNTGVFLQITADDSDELPIPGQAATFGVVKAAQARGDFDVLVQRGRRALRAHLKGNVGAGLAALEAAFKRAV